MLLLFICYGCFCRQFPLMFEKCYFELIEFKRKHDYDTTYTRIEPAIATYKLNIDNWLIHKSLFS